MANMNYKLQFNVPNTDRHGIFVKWLACVKVLGTSSKKIRPIDFHYNCAVFRCWLIIICVPGSSLTGYL